jgi:hypothetical protein
MGSQGFQDVTGMMGLHTPTLTDLGFGTLMLDFDQDGAMELIVANGHVYNQPVKNKNFKMKTTMFTLREKRWIACASEAGEYFQKKLVGRGIASADWDADGDWDLTIVNQNDPVAFLHNESTRQSWLKLEFRGHASNRRGIGCRVYLKSGSYSDMQELCGGTSYASSNQPALIFGLGEHADPVTLQVKWPSGREQTITDVRVNQSLLLEEPRE